MFGLDDAVEGYASDGYNRHSVTTFVCRTPSKKRDEFTPAGQSQACNVARAEGIEVTVATECVFAQNFQKKSRIVFIASLVIAFISCSYWP
jgi:hypothetical protein